jgi:hypothetical protein
MSGAFGGVPINPNRSNINPVTLQLLNMKLPDGSYLIPPRGRRSVWGTGPVDRWSSIDGSVDPLLSFRKSETATRLHSTCGSSSLNIRIEIYVASSFLLSDLTCTGRRKVYLRT